MEKSHRVLPNLLMNQGDRMTNWRHPIKGDVSFSEICKFIRDTIHLDGNHHTFRILIGTDSQNHGSIGTTRYVTAIILHKVGKGANFFVKRQDEPFTRSLRQKIWQESYLTLQYASELDQELADVLQLDNVEFQVHVDCGSNGPTRDLIQEVCGLFTAAGYDVVTKPYSAAASSAADRFSK
jgi:uncharacterized protein